MTTIMKKDVQPVDSLHLIIGTELFFSWYKNEDNDILFYESDSIGSNYKNTSIYFELCYKWGLDIVKK